MSSVCRTCLQEIENPADMYKLSVSESSFAEVTLGQKLTACIPELVLDLTVDAAICWPCTTALQCAYGFRQQCLESEARIKTYMNKTRSSNISNLGQVIQDDDVMLINSEQPSASEEPKTKDLLGSGTSKPSLLLNLESSSADKTNPKGSEMKKSKADSLYKTPSPHLLKELLSAKPYKCKFCSYKTIKTSKFKVHQRLHAGGTSKSSLCDFNGAIEIYLADNGESAVESHTCNQCSYKTLMKESILKHLRLHVPKAACLCNLCNLSDRPVKRKKTSQL